MKRHSRTRCLISAFYGPQKDYLEIGFGSTVIVPLVFEWIACIELHIELHLTEFTTPGLDFVSTLFKCSILCASSTFLDGLSSEFIYCAILVAFVVEVQDDQANIPRCFLPSQI